MTTLLHRFIILNACAFAAVVYVFSLGYAQQIFAGGMAHTILAYSVVALFIVTWLSAAWQVLAVNEAVRNATKTVACRRHAARLPIRQAHLHDAVEWLVMISLIGNAVGFYISSKGIDPSTLASTEGIVSNAGKMLGGVGVAISGTILGVICAMWLSVNVRMLDTATQLLIEEVK